jgi:hypothetical protein
MRGNREEAAGRGKKIKKLIEYKILGYQTNGNNEIKKEPMQ